MTKLTLIISIILILLMTNCGFKVVNDSNLKNFKIAEIITTGDKRINYKIKNKLISFASKNEKKLIKLNLVSNKIKSIKEKNIKNEITKYQIILDSNIQLNLLGTEKKSQIKLSSSGDYLVAKNYSTTINNEKQLIDNLVENLSEKILDEINLNF